MHSCNFCLGIFIFIIKEEEKERTLIGSITFINSEPSVISIEVSYKFLNKTSEITRVQKSHKWGFLKER